MARKPRAGNSYKTQYKAYIIRGQWRKNKLAKLTRRALRNEKDTHALDVFEKGSKTYGRRKPGYKGWFHPQEMKLINIINNAELDVAKEARIELERLRTIYADKRPSAIKEGNRPTLPTSIPDQLLNIGIINAKCNKTFKQSHGRLYGGRTVSNRR